jgi:cyclase
MSLPLVDVFEATLTPVTSVRPYERGITKAGATTFAYLQPSGGWGWSNAGLIVGQEEAVLVDTFFDLKTTRDLLDGVREVTDVPIATLVNTHHNGDHCWGNQLVEGATIVGHANCREELVSGASPAFIAGMLQAEGDGGAVGYFKRAFGSFDFSGIEVTPPTVTFEDALTLHLDGRPLHLLHFGPAHTLGDIAVWVPDERVLFCGDLLFLGSTPLVWEGSLTNWIVAVDSLLALEPEVVVPGHGPTCGPEGLREMQGYLQHVVSEGARLREEGLPVLEAARRIDLGRYASWADSERIALNLMRLDLELAGHPAHTRVDPFEAFNAMAEVAGAS